MLGSMPDLLNHVGLDAIQHARQHRLGRLPDDAEDRERDQKANDGIGEGEA